MDSVWTDIKMPRFPMLEGEKKTDVLIIGGGAAGLLCAYFLKKAGIDCTLVEKSRICSGVTSGTTAKITAQHGFIYHKLLKKGGLDAAQKYYRANSYAIERYAELCRNIDCDFVRRDNYVYTRNGREKAEAEQRALEGIGARSRFTEKTSLPFRVDAAVMFPDQAQFHPLKFFSAIADGLPIYENTFVSEMIGNTAVTDRGTIHADTVIVTTHFPFINKHGSYFLKMYQFRSYVLALEGAQKVGAMYVDEAEGGLSFRDCGDLLLFGGCGAHTGKPCGGWDSLRRLSKKFYPDSRETASWAAQDCMTLDGVPYIGRYSARTENMYVATGFNKWGMTGSMTAATVLTDTLLGKTPDYADVFSPSRSMLTPQLIKNCCNSAANLLTFSRKRCPHLGCALKWNAAEHSWDCPCHGSRFDENGTVLNNPANGDLEV